MDRSLWSSVSAVLRDAGQLELPVKSSQRRAKPADYGAYFDLAFPLPSDSDREDEIRAAASRQLIARLSVADVSQPSAVDAPTKVSVPHVSTLGRTHYSKEAHDQLIRWMDIEPINPMGLAGGADDDLEKARAQIERVFEILQEAAPELHGETVSIIDEILSVRPDGTHRLEYGGGSTFALWGLILINADAHDSWPQFCKAIVHEAAHNLLFAIGLKESLVLNDPDESYFSPVRDDRRPMDGIFHGFFVAARESFAFDRILAWDDENRALSAEERTAVIALLEDSVINFWQCDEAMARDVSFSPLGTAILADCKDYMQRNFALVSE